MFLTSPLIEQAISRTENTGEMVILHPSDKRGGGVANEHHRYAQPETISRIVNLQGSVLFGRGVKRIVS